MATLNLEQTAYLLFCISLPIIIPNFSDISHFARFSTNFKKKNENKILFLFHSPLSHYQVKRKKQKRQTTNNFHKSCISCCYTRLDTSDHSSNWSRLIAGNSRSSSKWTGPSGKNISWPDSLYLAEGRSILDSSYIYKKFWIKKNILNKKQYKKSKLTYSNVR
jgi:hypothetical protein